MPHWLIPLVLMLGLAACGSVPKKTQVGAAMAGATKGIEVKAKKAKEERQVSNGCPSASPYAQAQENPSTRGDYVAGGLYKPWVKDSTPDHVPNVACIPEPQVINEPYSVIGNRSPYQVLGKTYVVMDNAHGYVERGAASYYGNKFHGRLTSNREVYDMYAFTAAHRTLPLPSFALVTNLDNGASVVVRINDRGPFHEGRLIDLSYAAAVKLGIAGNGTGHVEVRGLTEVDSADALAKRRGQSGVAAIAAVPPVKSKAQSGADDLPTQQLPNRSDQARAAVNTPPAGERWRYRVADSHQPGNADNFDAWMRAHGVHVVGGNPARAKPAAPPLSSVATNLAASRAPEPAVPMHAQVLPAATVKLASAAESALGSILLQIASFASRENANRALSQLSSAGIAGVAISDIFSGGRQLWRLRINARDQQTAAELAGRIAALGFGRPQIVNN